MPPALRKSRAPVRPRRQSQATMITVEAQTTGVSIPAALETSPDLPWKGTARAVRTNAMGHDRTLIPASQARRIEGRSSRNVGTLQVYAAHGEVGLARGPDQFAVRRVFRRAFSSWMVPRFSSAGCARTSPSAVLVAPGLVPASRPVPTLPACRGRDWPGDAGPHCPAAPVDFLHPGNRASRHLVLEIFRLIAVSARNGWPTVFRDGASSRWRQRLASS